MSSIRQLFSIGVDVAGEAHRVLGDYTKVYKPSADVESAHNIPHVYRGAQVSDPQIGQPDFRTYVETLITTPIVFLVLGILSVLIYQFILFTRCCCKCSKWTPDQKDVDAKPYFGDRVKWAAKTVSRRRWYSAFFLFFVAFVFFSIHGLWLGYAKLKQGALSSISNIEDLKTIFTTTTSAASAIQLDGQSAYDEINNLQLSCFGNQQSVKDSLLAFASGIKTAGSALYGLTKGIPDDLQIGQDYITMYMIDALRLAVAIYYAVIFFFGLIYILGAFCLKSRCAMWVSIGFTEIIVIILTIICVIEMILVMLLGDFCMDPTGYILQIFPAGSSLRDIMAYYTQCTGTNPFEDDIDSAQENAQDAIDQIVTLSAYSCNFNAVQSALSDVVNTQVDIISGELIDCAPLANIYTGIMNDSICGSLFSGFFTVWVASFLTSACLFFSMCFAAILYQYFPPEFWYLDSEGNVKGAESQNAASSNNSAETGSKTTAPDYLAEVEFDNIEMQRQQQNTDGNLQCNVCGQLASPVIDGVKINDTCRTCSQGSFQIHVIAAQL